MVVEGQSVNDNQREKAYDLHLGLLGQVKIRGAIKGNERPVCEALFTGVKLILSN
jgi:hypothetical protein